MNIAEPDAGVGGDPLESGREGAIVDDLAARAINVVWDHIERRRQDHAEQSVAADHMPEQLCILVARRGDHPAVCEHQPDAAQRAHHGARLMIHAVRVDADRPPDGEDVGGLHRLHREPRMHGQLDRVPGRAAAHRDSACRRVEPDCVHAAHVEHHAPGAERLAAHRVLHARCGNGKPVGAGITQRRGDIGLASHADHAGDGRAAEAARVIDMAATLRPVRFAHGGGAGPLLRQRRQHGGAILGAGGIGSQRRDIGGSPGGGERQDGGSNQQALMLHRIGSAMAASSAGRK